jgi:hypothetical protein
VDSSGTVRWTNFTEDIRIRAKADEILAARASEVGSRAEVSTFWDYLCIRVQCTSAAKAGGSISFTAGLKTCSTPAAGHNRVAWAVRCGI